jgi:hypothetical protein
MKRKIAQSVFCINGIKKAAVAVRSDQERESVDGGAPLLDKADEKLSLSAGLSRTIRDG